MLAVLLVRRVDRTAPYAPDPEGEAPLDFRYLTGFLIPLIITQFALTIGHPMVNAGLLRLPNPEATVGAFRLAFSLGMLPLTAMAALRQVVLVLGRDADQQRRARRFVYAVGLGMTGLMALVAFTPLNHAIIAGLVGAPPALVPDAIVALQILAVFPLLMAVRQFYQSMTMNQRKTRSGGDDRVLTAADDGVVPVRADPGDGLDRRGRGGRGPDRGHGHGGSGGLPGRTAFCGGWIQLRGRPPASRRHPRRSARSRRISSALRRSRSSSRWSWVQE